MHLNENQFTGFNDEEYDDDETKHFITTTQAEA